MKLYDEVTQLIRAGYIQSVSGDCFGTINAGDNKVCTITNNDNPQTGDPSITVSNVRCTRTSLFPLVIYTA